MATVTVLSAARTLEIDDATIVSGTVVDGHLILIRKDDSEVDVGDITVGLLTETESEAQFVTRIKHNGTSYAARPVGVPAGMAEYVGPTTPTDWQTGDTWVETA